MYLWKYWRESRITFGIGVLVLGLLLALLFHAHFFYASTTPRESYPNPINTILFLTAAPLAIIAWGIGSSGVGRNLGEGAGAFLFTRPRRRSWFVWRDWAFGVALIAVLVILYDLFEAKLLPGAIKLRDLPEKVSLTHLLALNDVILFLFCGLIFGVVYLLTIVLKNALGTLAAGGLMAGYVILGGVLHHYYDLQLPYLMLRGYVTSPVTGAVVGIADHIGISVAIRTAVLLLFPIAAQLILERSDI
jgi:hypothetical protein